MIRRLLKDLRVLAPGGLFGALAAAVAVHWSGPAGLGILLLVAVASSVQVFGHEYTHRRMDWLLAQPLTRRGLWLQKAAALNVFLVLLLSLALALGAVSEAVRQRAAGGLYSTHTTVFGERDARDAAVAQKILVPMKEYRRTTDYLCGSVLGEALAYGTLWTSRLLDQPMFLIWRAHPEDAIVIQAPDVRRVISEECQESIPLLFFLIGASSGGMWMGLWLRRSHTAFWAALVLPVGFFLLWHFLVPHIYFWGRDTDLLGPSLVWGVCGLVGSLIHIQRLEV